MFDGAPGQHNGFYALHAIIHNSKNLIYKFIGCHICIKEDLLCFLSDVLFIGLAGALYAHFLGVVNPDAFYLGVTFITLAMLVVGGINSLSGAVLGVVVISAIIQILRWLEKGIDLGSLTLSIPNGIQEIAIGIVMIAILMFRPSGIMRNRELTWQRWPFT